MENNKLYVGNLSWDTTEAGLRSAFSSFGDVVEVALIMDRDTGRPRGFGFVTMRTDEQAAEAKSELDGKDLDGRAIRVNIAESRPNGSRRSKERW